MLNHPVVAIDGFNLTMNAFIFRILGTRNEPQVDAAITIGEMSMSPGLAKMLTIKLKKLLQEHERQFGSIHIAKAILDVEGISLIEDWGPGMQGGEEEADGS
jgi:hypothetical protein